MGEQPIFTTKAHVFHIDPNTKKKWLPTSPQAVHVSYYYDSTRQTYRIISVDGSKAVINSTITPTMQFTKTSQKFGQWSDQRANTVYGLGFSSEEELSKFIEKFREVKELTRQAAQDAHTNGVDPHDHVSSDTSGSPSDSPKPPLPPNLLLNDTSGTETNNRSSSPNHPSNTQVDQPSNTQVEQLRYENDRLKIALAQSSANAKKWEVELQTLKNNNARLTTALQESTTNVEEWKKQLAAYKEENARLKKKVLETDKSSGAGSELLQRQLTDTREKLQESDKTIEDKQKEILELTSRLEDVKVLEVRNQSYTDRIQNLESERDVLKKQVEDLQQQVDSSKTSHIREKQQLRSVQERLGNKLKELQELHAEISDVTQQNR